MDIQQELMDIGLTDKEAAAYLVLLRFGTRSTSYVAQKARLNRGTAYVALHSLLAKGLVAKASKRKVQHFSALDPEHLLATLQCARPGTLARFPRSPRVGNPSSHGEGPYLYGAAAHAWGTGRQ